VRFSILIVDTNAPPQILIQLFLFFSFCVVAYTLHLSTPF